MQCINPVKIKFSEETLAKRRQDETLDMIDRYRTYMYVPCGKCEACLSNRRSAWSFRLHQELKVSESCYFLTLTYDDQYLPYKTVTIDGVSCEVPCVSKRDVQLFLKRFRKCIEPFKIRYFIVSEYGPKTYRPHYHMILFNYPQLLKNKIDEYIEESWRNGFVRVDPVSDARIHYVTSYCLDSSTLPSYLPKNFMLCSRRPGLGSAYLDNYSVVKYHLDNLDPFGHFPSSSGDHKVKLPRYYSDKLFTDAQRHQICHEFSEWHIEQRIRLGNRQRRWLRRRGIEPTIENIRIPYVGSPLAAELAKRKDFQRKVQNMCKNKKNG